MTHISLLSVLHISPFLPFISFHFFPFISIIPFSFFVLPPSISFLSLFIILIPSTPSHPSHPSLHFLTSYRLLFSFHSLPSLSCLIFFSAFPSPFLCSPSLLVFSHLSLTTSSLFSLLFFSALKSIPCFC